MKVLAFVLIAIALGTFVSVAATEPYQPPSGRVYSGGQSYDRGEREVKLRTERANDPQVAIVREKPRVIYRNRYIDRPVYYIYNRSAERCCPDERFYRQIPRERSDRDLNEPSARHSRDRIADRDQWYERYGWRP